MNSRCCRCFRPQAIDELDAAVAPSERPEDSTEYRSQCPLDLMDSGNIPNMISGLVQYVEGPQCYVVLAVRPKFLNPNV